MKYSHPKKLMQSLALGLCLLPSLTLISTPSYGDLQEGGRTNAHIYYKLDQSAQNFGYAPHLKAAAEQWNGITPAVSLSPLEDQATQNGTLPDLYCVSNSRIEGLLGAHLPYSKSAFGKLKPAKESDSWQFSAIMLYHNNMKAYQLSYREKVSNAAHEIGHSLALSHPTGQERSIMRQGIQVIAPTSFDRFELRRKWGLSGLVPKQHSKDDIVRIQVHANYERYDQVDLADKSADLIVLAHPTKALEKRKATIHELNNGIISDFYTYTDLKVEKVLKQDPKMALKENADLQVLEPIALGQADGNAALYQYEGYSAMEADQSYIVFLKKNSYGNYSVMNMSLGRIDLHANQPLLKMENVPLDTAAAPSSNDAQNAEAAFIKSAIDKYIK